MTITTKVNGPHASCAEIALSVSLSYDADRDVQVQAMIGDEVVAELTAELASDASVTRWKQFQPQLEAAEAEARRDAARLAVARAHLMTIEAEAGPNYLTEQSAAQQAVAAAEMQAVLRNVDAERILRRAAGVWDEAALSIRTAHQATKQAKAKTLDARAGDLKTRIQSHIASAQNLMSEFLVSHFAAKRILAAGQNHALQELVDAHCGPRPK